MSTKILSVSHWNEGISSSEKEGPLGSFFFGRSLDIHSEPTTTKILPRTAKISSTTVTALGLLKPVMVLFMDMTRMELFMKTTLVR